MNLVNEALELYNKIKEEQHSRKKPLPSATYNQILIAFANKGDSDTTEKILKDMAFDKINPSRLARLAMKKMYDTKGRPDITMEIYRHFRNLRLSNKE
jgi:pentatricopeptide repeat protein